VGRVGPERIDGADRRTCRGAGPAGAAAAAGQGLTQERLAEQAGLSTRAIQDLERGLSVPRRDTLERLVRALGLEGKQRVAFEAVHFGVPHRPTRSRSKWLTGVARWLTRIGR
jgi:transcriptional regulator with XRE-family HTH domain